MNLASTTAMIAALHAPTVTEQLGWALLHFVWQGTLVALGYAVLKPLLRHAGARAKYACAAVAMLSCAIAFTTTLALLPDSAERDVRLEVGIVPQLQPTQDSNPAASPATPPILTMMPAEPTVIGKITKAVPDAAVAPSNSSLIIPWRDWLARFQSLASHWVPWIVPAWLAGVLLLGGRVFIGWRGTMQLRRDALIVADERLLNMLNTLRQRLRLPRTVKLLATQLVDSPMTMGWWRPVVLVPTSLLFGMDARTLEFLFAHELAHVRRWDYLVNWLQVLVETLLFFHPIVWWLGHDLRCLREECCDDLAIAATGDRTGYVRALVNLEEHRAMWPALAPAAHGGSLLQRVRRLLPRDTAPGARSRWGAGAALAVALAAVTLGFWQQQSRAGDESPAALIKAPPHGVVLDANGQPVPNCQLWLRYEADAYFLDHTSRTVDSATTDAQGRFRFKESMRFATLHGSLETEYFTILARKEGVGIGWEWVAGADPAESSLTVRMEPVHPLEVRVMDAARKPLPGATVWLASLNPPTQEALMHVSRPMGWVESVTNAEGKAFLDVPETVWGVAAIGPEGGPVYLTQRAYPSRIGGKLDPSQLLEITLALSSQMSGVVVDDQGMPVPGLPVLIERGDNSASRSGDHQQQVTDAAGRFHISDLRSYRKSGAIGWRIWATGADWTSEPVVIPLRPGEHRQDLRIEAMRGTLVRGTTKEPEGGRPVAGARIWVLPQRNGKMAFGATVWTDAEGRFNVRVPPGTTEFSLINLPAGWCNVGDGFGRSWDVHAKTPEQEITLDATGPLRRLVKVIGSVDPPMADVRVSAVADPGPARDQGARIEGTSRDRYLYGFSTETRTDAQGRFTAMEWPGDSQLLVFCRTTDFKRAGWMRIKTRDGLAMQEPVHLQETTSVRLRVTDADGKPVAGKTLDVFPEVDGRWLTTGPEATTDDKGFAVAEGVLTGVSYDIRDPNDISWNTNLVILKERPSGGSMPTVEVQLLRPTDESFSVQIRDQDGKPVRLEKIDYMSVDFDSPPGTPHRAFIHSYEKLKIKDRKDDGTHFLASEERVDTYAIAVPFELRGTLADGTIVTAKGTLEPGAHHVPVTLDQVVAMITPPRIQLDGVAPDEVAGRVVDPSGQPVSGADVTLMSWSAADLGTVTTGADGVFRGKLDLGTEDGRTVVYTKDPTRSKKWKDDRTGSMEWDEKRHPFEMVRVEKEGFATAWVINGKVGEPFEAKLDNTTRLKGVFTGPDGKPLRDVIAVVITTRGSFREWPTRPSSSLPLSSHLTLVRKSEDGAYDWLMEPGDYTIELRNRDGLCAQVKSFHVKSGRTQAIPATFAPGCDLGIRLVDTAGKPVPGITISRSEYFGGTTAILGERSSLKTSDAEGWVRWKGLPPWKGWFSVYDVKLKRCLDDANFRDSRFPVTGAPLGENATDKLDSIRLDLTKIHETTIQVQVK